MRVTRVHVDAPLAAGRRLALPVDAAAYLTRVLRLQPGDDCVLFNGDGVDYPARLLAAGKRGADVEILGAQPVDLLAGLYPGDPAAFARTGCDAAVERGGELERDAR